MPLFDYQGRNRAGQMVRGSMEAANESALADSLMRQGVMPTAIRPGKAKGAALDWQSLLQGSVPLSDLVIFSRQMYSLTKAGIPILRAIKGLADSTHHQRLKKALLDLGEQLATGRPLSTAMRDHRHVFNPLFISLVKVGENTGQLENAFLQLAQYFELEQETRRRIKAAMRYPTFVVFALGAALVVMNMLVIPQFAGMFAKFGVELPLATRILISTSNFFVHHWHWLLFSLTLLVAGIRYSLSTKAGRIRWDRWKLRLPVVGSVVERALLARFSRCFAMMLKAGVPLNSALTLVADAVNNAFVAERVTEMRSGIERGESLLMTANRSELFTPLVLQMLAVGEETGQVDELLEEAADFYEREVDYDLKSMTARIEPILIAIVAGMVLVLALGIFTPMWDMMSTIR